MNSDKKLAERMKKGNEKAFEEIIYRFTPLVSNIIRNISSGYLSNEDIEEVTTDVFVTLWKNSEKLDVNMLKPYIICIAKSRVKDRLRRENKFGIVDIDSVDIADDGDIFEKYENESLVSDLKEEISKLKEPDKEILIRYYYYYQPVKEISEIMGINIETVKSKLQRMTKLWKTMNLRMLSLKKS